MLDGKQRAALRSKANKLEVVVTIGKGGLGGNITESANAALAARELIKCRVLATCPDDAESCAHALSDALHADVVQVIGTRFVLYRYNPELHKAKPGVSKVPQRPGYAASRDTERPRGKSGARAAGFKSAGFKQTGGKPVRFKSAAGKPAMRKSSGGRPSGTKKP